MMKRMLAISVTVAVLLLAVPPLLGAPKAGDTITVRVIKTKLMKEPKHIGKTVTDVSRSQHLTFVAEKSSWYQVKTEAGELGWIHKSKVTDKKVQLSSDAGKDGTTASQEEIELAGRGFTPEVEEEYRKKNANLDFSHVDAIEKTTLAPEGLSEFVSKGKLGGGR